MSTEVDDIALREDIPEPVAAHTLNVAWRVVKGTSKDQCFYTAIFSGESLAPVFMVPSFAGMETTHGCAKLLNHAVGALRWLQNAEQRLQELRIVPRLELSINLLVGFGIYALDGEGIACKASHFSTKNCRKGGNRAHVTSRLR